MSKPAHPILVVCVAVLILASARGARAADAKPAPDPAAIEFFEKKIRPVLSTHCYECHSTTSTKVRGGLLLDTRDGLLKGGTSGTAVELSDIEKSLLLKAVRYKDKDLQMPPTDPLPAEVVADLETWVKLGAPYPVDEQPEGHADVVLEQPAMTVAEGRQFWSFKKPIDPPVPSVDAPAARTDVDRFILAKLEEKNLTLARPADKRALIRRVTFDLTGLPPTPAEIEAFEADASEGAFEKVIDRLLASPHYGERWGRYWLDVARYADTKGYVFEEERRFPFSYTYRDWVIRAFNEDLPYDRFLIQQIAADRLDLKDDKRPLAALGFLTLGRRFLNNPHDIADDRIDVVTRGTMGLTVSCARCHDHKYDPIPTADYYSLYGVFASAAEPKELPLITFMDDPDSPERTAFETKRKELEAKVEETRVTLHAERLKKLRSADEMAAYLLAAHHGEKVTDEKLKEIFGEKLQPNKWMLKRWRDYLAKTAETHDPVFAPWHALAAIPEPEFAARAKLTLDALRGKRLATTAAAAATTAPVPATAPARPAAHPQVMGALALKPALTSMKDVAQRYAHLLAAYDKPEPAGDARKEMLRQVTQGEQSPTSVALADAGHVFDRDDQNKIRQPQNQLANLIATHPGSPPRAMALEDGPKPHDPKIFKRGNPASPGDAVPRQFLAVLSPDDRQPFKDGSGRLELAQAIASRDNPLTARVMANRVWQYHFGEGIVRTPSDFGTRGEPPTHPELLDYLAVRFMEGGWSVKKLHKLILMSATYEQASDVTDAAALAAGQAADPENKLLWRQNRRRLDLEAMRDAMLAAAGRLDLTVGGRPVDILKDGGAPRRTVYGFIDRQNLPGLFRTFDFASPDTTSPQRFQTSVPQQALFMMNSPFALEQARALAKRPDVAAMEDAEERVRAMYRSVYGRAPSADEVSLAVRFIAQEQQHAAAPVMAEAPVWEYGFGEYDPAGQKVRDFTPLPHFADAQYKGGPKLPDAKHGWAMLSGQGGHPGDAKHAVVRRWVAPRDGMVTISGMLAHVGAPAQAGAPAPEGEDPAAAMPPRADPSKGDGVHARVITTLDGELASWVVDRKTAETKIENVFVKKGYTIDFVVDSRKSTDYDSFTWPVQVKMTKPYPAVTVAGDDGSRLEWDGPTQFAGPAGKSNPLDPWERYAQVLLQSNEFVFVD